MVLYCAHAFYFTIITIIYIGILYSSYILCIIRISLSIVRYKYKLIVCMYIYKNRL